MIIAWFVVAVSVCVVFIYNKLVKKDNLTKEAESGINVQLKRRYDLIPSLVEVVKAYAKHEAQTLESVISQRSAAYNGSQEEQFENEMALSRSLKALFAVVENYPDLKANQSFLELQTSLEYIEEQIQQARRYYNATVREFNTAIEVFPNNIIARGFHFERKAFFDVRSEEERNPQKLNLS